MFRLNQGRSITLGATVAMKAKPETDNAEASTKSATRLSGRCSALSKVQGRGFVQVRLRGISNAATDWRRVALAHNVRRIANMQAA